MIEITSKGLLYFFRQSTKRVEIHLFDGTIYGYPLELLTGQFTLVKDLANDHDLKRYVVRLDHFPTVKKKDFNTFHSAISHFGDSFWGWARDVMEEPEGAALELMAVARYLGASFMGNIMEDSLIPELNSSINPTVLRKLRMFFHRHDYTKCAAKVESLLAAMQKKDMERYLDGLNAADLAALKTMADTRIRRISGSEALQLDNEEIIEDGLFM